MKQLFKSSCIIAIALFIGSVQIYSSNDKVTEIRIVADNDSVVATPDTLPEYRGGEEALVQFLGSNLTYPAECAENDVQGKVLVRFVVTKDGKVDEVTVKTSVHPLLDAEAVRVVSLLNDWIPGKYNGKTVNTYYTLPISFKLQNEESIEAQIKAEDWKQFYGLAQEAKENNNIPHAIAYYWECFDINPQITSPLEDILQINNGETKYGTNIDILTKAYLLVQNKERSYLNKQSYTETTEWLREKINTIDSKALERIEQRDR